MNLSLQNRLPSSKLQLQTTLKLPPRRQLLHVNNQGQKCSFMVYQVGERLGKTSNTHEDVCYLRLAKSSCEHPIRLLIPIPQVISPPS